VHTLRELRAKESEAALRHVYESQTMAYLEDAIQPCQKTPLSSSSKDGFQLAGFDSSVDGTIIEEEEDEDDLEFATGNWWSHSSILALPRNDYGH